MKGDVKELNGMSHFQAGAGDALLEAKWVFQMQSSASPDKDSYMEGNVIMDLC